MSCREFAIEPVQVRCTGQRLTSSIPHSQRRRKSEEGLERMWSCSMVLSLFLVGMPVKISSRERGYRIADPPTKEPVGQFLQAWTDGVG